MTDLSENTSALFFLLEIACRKPQPTYSLCDVNLTDDLSRLTYEVIEVMQIYRHKLSGYVCIFEKAHITY